jgi:diguanylate cyclase (GGDEF)-like protein
MLVLNIDTLSLITLSFLSGALILTLFYYYLYYLNKNKYLKLWFASWLTLAIAYLFLFFSFYLDLDFLYGLYAFFITVYSYLFFLASAEFLKFERTKKSMYVVSLIIGVILIFTPFKLLLPWTIPIAFTTTSILFIMIGILFIKKNDFLKKLTGFIIIVFSIFAFFYPYIALYEWFSPWGYILLGIAGIFMGMSLIQIHFQDQKNELLSIHKKLNYLAHHDSLTKLKNRFSMNSIFEKINDNKEINVGLLFIDLNDFKLINDEHGHQAGDRTLVIISKYLKEIIPEQTQICRLGGDEFVIILKNSSEKKTKDLRDTILNNGQGHIFENVKLDFAVGYAFKSKIDQDIYELLNDAEKEMYRVKAKQKN